MAGDDIKTMLRKMMGMGFNPFEDGLADLAHQTDVTTILAQISQILAEFPIKTGMPADTRRYLESIIALIMQLSNLLSSKQAHQFRATARKSGLTTLPPSAGLEQANRIVQENFDAIQRSLNDLRNRLDQVQS